MDFVSFLLFHRSSISCCWLAVVDGLTVVLDVVVVADVVVVVAVVVVVDVVVLGASVVPLVTKGVVCPEVVLMFINR